MQGIACVDAGLQAALQRRLVDHAVAARESREIDAHTDPRRARGRLQANRRHDRSAALRGQQGALRQDAVGERGVDALRVTQLPQGAPQAVTVIDVTEQHIAPGRRRFREQRCCTGPPQAAALRGSP